MGKRALLPLTGILAVVLVIVSFSVAGEPPDADAPIRDVVSFYVDHDSEQQFAAAMLGWAAVLFLFFASSLRGFLRRAEGDAGGGMSTLSFAGAILFAVGLSIFAAISFTLGDVAEDLDPAAVQTLHAMNEDFFFPAAVGVATFLLGTGIAIIKTRALPKWLGWLVLVIGVLGVTPIGFVAFMLLGLVVIVLSVMLAMRAGDDRPTAASP